MENPAVDQLPEAHSLPDGFVDSSVEPLAPSTPMLEQEMPLTDYKEEKLVEPDSSPDLVVGELQSSEEKTEKSENSRTFPVTLTENDASDPLPELGEVDGCVEDVVRESGEQLAGSSCGKLQDQKKCHSSEKAIEGGSDTQAAHMNEICKTESAGNNRKLVNNILHNIYHSCGILFLQKKVSTDNFLSQETSEVKRKNTKRTFKSEKEFLEFTLKYQQVLSERDAAIAVRDKLESLCRELQRQNKMLMDECKRVSTEGQNLRLDLSNKFQDAIKEVSHKLEEQKDESLSQLKENEMLRIKLKQLADQYALSEQQYAQKLKQKTLELQIADLKTQQHEEKLLQEQSQLKFYAEQVSELLANEKNLRLQLTADGEKFQQFQDALVKSNEVFETFKQEIEKMAKSIKQLKKENAFLKSKSEKSDITLIELVEEREHLKKQLEKTKNQKEKLESLCRSLQAERKQNSTGGGSNTDSVAV
ncbi:beta-taxilin-like isoform X1 [Camellia sinensis]|uniref:beta-taxilin-like isoform X1 n=1 Tax=Camellia sinensis TaxID=4442 RepID=UPI001036893F|nr:beta-taxilin-like isoform X1 [Camellia sinensis]